MTVYVDNMRMPARVGSINAKWSHLTADTKAELHEFAQSIGLRREWFQEDASFPTHWHYDVTDGKRALAIQRGAVPIDIRELFDVVHKEGRET